MVQMQCKKLAGVKENSEINKQWKVRHILVDDPSPNIMYMNPKYTKLCTCQCKRDCFITNWHTSHLQLALPMLTLTKTKIRGTIGGQSLGHS